MGKLDPGTRYPAHGSQHADGGSQHAENYSVEGCTLLAVLTTDDPLVAFAMA